MKKLLCLLLALMMVFCLFGCEERRDDDDDDDDREEKPKTEFAMGEVSNQTYENAFLGISCTLSSEWTYLTEAEILEINNIASGYMDDQVAEQLKNAAIVYDMYAKNTLDTSSININMEKHTASQLKNVNLKQVLESQIPVIRSTYENIGYTDIQVQYQKIQVDGKTFDSIGLTASYYGTEFHMVCFTFVRGNYIANVSIGSPRSSVLEEVLRCFDIQ